MSDRIIDFIFSGVWLLALYMVFLWYRAKKENNKLNKLWDEDWKNLKEQYNKTVYLERENINLKGEVKSLKELNQACMEKIIKLKQ